MAFGGNRKPFFARGWKMELEPFSFFVMYQYVPANFRFLGHYFAEDDLRLNIFNTSVQRYEFYFKLFQHGHVVSSRMCIIPLPSIMPYYSIFVWATFTWDATGAFILRQIQLHFNYLRLKLFIRTSRETCERIAVFHQFA